MTQLTKEERALLKTSLTVIYQALPDNHDDEVDAHFGQVEKLVDQLSARVEELEEADRQWDKYSLVEIVKQRNTLQSNLSSLLSAVEPIVKAIEDFTLADEQGICDEALMHNDGLKDIKTGDLRHLSTVAAGIRGGKG